jgi:hypothetical protein
MEPKIPDKSKAQYCWWCRAQEGYCHYTAPAGMSSLVKHFFTKSSPRVQTVFNRRVSAVDQLGEAWLVSTECGHQVRAFP